jgi:hypothetical protein
VTGLVVVSVAAIVAGLAFLALAIGQWRRGLDARLQITDGELRRLADAAAYRDAGSSEVRREVQAFRAALEAMEIRERERRAREEQAWAALQRVTAVLAGSQRTGRVGENVLREAFANLPPSMVVTDLRVNGRVVEFGLVLPDGRRLAIDSKWTADRELQELAEATDPVRREQLTRIVEAEVGRRAKEVAGYLDPAVTAPLAVAAVPDSAYAVLRRAHADAYRMGVVVISYSQALPFILFLHGIMSRVGGATDAQACLADLAALVDAMESTLENKLTRAATMLSNGAEELRGQVGKARSTIARGSAPARSSQASLHDAGAVSLPGVVVDTG